MHSPGLLVALSLCIIRVVAKSPKLSTVDAVL